MTRTCLIIAPLAFHAVHAAVATELRTRGYQVDLLNDEYPANLFGKALGRFGLAPLRRLTLRGLQKRLGQRRFDLVLIFKGRGIGPAAAAYLKSRADRVIGYNFDSFRLNPSPLDWHDLVDAFATFDPADARADDLALIPLFSAAHPDPDIPPAYDLSVLFRVHSQRLAYLAQVLDAVPGLTSRLYLYTPLILLPFHLALSPRLTVRFWPHIHTRPLPHTQAMQWMQASAVTLDYAHPGQSGLTIRCFEAQSLGVALLTNNPELARSGLFAPQSHGFFPLNGTAAQLKIEFAKLVGKRPQRRLRSVAEFVDDVLAVAPKGRSN